MKKGSKSFLPVIVTLICLLCVSSVGATAHIPFNRGKQFSSNFLQKDKVTRLADLPVTAWEKISQQLRKAEYEVSRCERTLPSGKASLYRALNHNQKLSAYFSEQGVQLLPHGRGEPGWHLQMTLYGYGYDGSVKPLQSVKSNVMKASGRRIECRRGVLTEWYVNDESGIEQGVTLNEPPEGRHRRPLLVEWIVSGSLQPQIERQGEELTFDKPDGSQVLRYSGIKAWDVTGRFLPAKLTVSKGASNEPISRINYVVDDDGACYPVTIDPIFTQRQRIVPSDGADWDGFGGSVAIDGDTVVVGASGNIGDGSESGSAYIFARNQGGTNNWGEVKRIIPSDGENYDNFGGSVAIDGDTVVVGASGNIGDGSNSGSAYIFARNQGGTNNWGEVKRIIPSDGAANDEFGGSVAVDGDTVVVGAALKDVWVDGPKGAAYIFQRNQGATNNWGEVKILTGGPMDFYFGCSVAIDGDTLIIGAYKTVDLLPCAGSAYVFYRDQEGPDNWGLVKRIVHSEAGSGERFGYSVAIDGNTLVIGAPYNGGWRVGAAYVFDRDQDGPDNWGEVQKIIASDGAQDDEFGSSVTIYGDTVVVGAYRNDDNVILYSGSAYVFDRDQGGPDNWGEVQKITASDAGWGHEFGWSVTIDGGTVVIGEPGGNKDIYTSSGAAYVFLAYALYDPDLVVQSIVTDPSEPVAGQTVGVSVTVKNIGVVGANTPFYVHWYADRTSAPSPGLGSGDQYEQFTSLAAGATCTMNTTWTYSSAGDYNMWAYVDYEELVTESDETNNVLGPENILVRACQGDFDVDGDVDGLDLGVFAAGGTDITLEEFAAEFGRTDCSN